MTAIEDADKYEAALERATTAAYGYVHFPTHADNVIAAFLANMAASGFQIYRTDQIERLKAINSAQKEALDFFIRNAGSMDGSND